MSDERRTGNLELIESLKDFKQDIKEDIKEIKDELKHVDSKVNDHININNKYYFNGFQPDKHVADHHVIDSIIEKVNEGRGLRNRLVEEVLKVAVVAALTFIGMSTWSGIKEEVKAPFDNKPKVEQNAKGN